MKPVLFPIDKVEQLRRQATEAVRVSPDGPEGWSISDVDPMNLLRVFPALRLKAGYTLRGYQYRDGGNGNGFIWAVPENLPFPDPETCPRLEGRFLDPPKPPEALDNLLDAIEGDGTPWSFLSASLFAREASEFGALWHGCSWSTHIILGSDPCESCSEEQERLPMEGPTGGPDDWKWLETKPARWEPCYRTSRVGRTIMFFTFSGLGQETIYRWTDAYKKGSYNFTTHREQIAKGRRGFVF